MIKDDFGIKGSMIATLYKANGDVEVRRKDNIIVNAGFDFICNSIGLSASRPGVMSYIAVGTGTTAAAVTQTSLVTETLRKAATYAHTAGTKVFTMTATFLPGEATVAITEAGVLNAASAGTLMDRVVFSVINKGADDTLTCQFQFTLA